MPTSTESKEACGLLEWNGDGYRAASLREGGSGHKGREDGVGDLTTISTTTATDSNSDLSGGETSDASDGHLDLDWHLGGCADLEGILLGGNGADVVLEMEVILVPQGGGTLHNLGSTNEGVLVVTTLVRGRVVACRVDAVLSNSLSH